MARDYVGRKPNKNKRKKPAKNTAPKSRFPLIALLILIVVVAGFVTILVKIGNTAKKPAPLPTAVVPKVKKPVQVKALPKQPKEPAYIKELENKKVTVDVPKRKKSTHRYQMQCASFRNRADAEKMKAKIAFTGLNSQVRRSENKNGVWFRVVLGPYDTRRAGDRDRHLLQRNKINGCQLWYWTWD